MARPKLQTGSKTVPLVVHLPQPFKKKVIAAAEKREVGISQFVRETLEKRLHDLSRPRG